MKCMTRNMQRLLIGIPNSLIIGGFDKTPLGIMISLQSFQFSRLLHDVGTKYGCKLQNLLMKLLKKCTSCYWHVTHDRQKLLILGKRESHNTYYYIYINQYLTDFFSNLDHNSKHFSEFQNNCFLKTPNLWI